MQVKNEVDLHMENIALHKSLDAIWKLVRMTNKYIDETAPWALAKDTRQEKRLATVIHTLLESLRSIATLLFPFMPTSAEAMWRALGCSETLSQHTTSNGTQWGKLTTGTAVTKIPPLFPRIEG